MRRSQRVLGAIGAAVLVMGGTAAVQPAGAVGAGDATVSCPAGDLQAALTAATTGDTITIDGLCTGAYTFSGKEITIQGDPGTGEVTDGFDGPGTDTGSLLSGTHIGATTIQNLVFQNGSVDGNGGGLAVLGDSAPQLLNLAFLDNNADTSDGAGNGGGLYVDSSFENGELLLSNVAFTGNTADNNGGGFFINSSPHVRLQIVTATDNHAAITAPIGVEGGGGGFVRVSPFFSETGFEAAALADEAPGIEINDSIFTGNTTDSNGGGLLLNAADETNTITLTGNTFGGEGEGQGNSAPSSGGGLYVFTPGDVVMSDNDLLGNTTEGSGGGAWVGLLNNALANLDDNRFAGNVLLADEAPDHWGGGLFVQHFGTLPEGDVLTQVGNVFDGNTVLDTTEGESGGGGEWIVGAPTISRYDTYVNNVVENDTGQDTEGGGIGLVGSANGTTLRLDNAVVAGNSVDADGGPGSGGGVYVGLSCSPCNEVLTLHNTTVAGNTVTSPVIGAGVGGGGENDSLTAVNSIIAGNSTTGGEGTADIAGFTTTDVSFSDACAGPGISGGPHAGTGNICAEPLLVDPSPGTADVHQTSSSPTVDKGSNALVPPEIATDIDDDARVMGGVVDMGADELVPPSDEEPVPGDGVTPPGSIGENDGYCLAAGDSGVFAFGNCGFMGTAAAGSGPTTAPTGRTLNAPIVGIAMTPDDKGYWMAGADGGVFAFGNAPFKGSLGGVTLTHPIVGIAATPTGQGYWLVASNGAIFAFGDAATGLGSAANLPLRKAVVAMAATPSGNGYWLVAEDGGVFAYGDAPFFGSAAGLPLNQPMIGISVRPGGNGYWLVATDGGVFSYGNSPFFGSFGGQPLNEPIVAMKSAATGNGYWLVASDGGVFSFGSAPFKGSTADLNLNYPIVDMTG